MQIINIIYKQIQYSLHCTFSLARYGVDQLLKHSRDWSTYLRCYE